MREWGEGEGGRGRGSEGVGGGRGREWREGMEGGRVRGEGVAYHVWYMYHDQLHT